MPDENDVEETDQVETGQPDEDTADQTPSELPADPDELKAHAAQLQEQLKEQQRTAKAAQREAERQAERAKEQETKANYWSKRANETAQAPARAQAQPDDDLVTALQGIDLAEFVTADDGPARLAKTLREKAGFVTQKDLDKALDSRVAIERATVSQYNDVVTQYPDLRDTGSELAKEASEQFARIAESNPDLSDPFKFELAASRAARKLGIDVKPATPPSNDRDRLRNAQGGPTNRGRAGTQTVQITPEARKLAQKIGGGSLDDAAIKRALASVQANQKARPR